MHFQQNLPKLSGTCIFLTKGERALPPTHTHTHACARLDWSLRNVKWNASCVQKTPQPPETIGQRFCKKIRLRKPCKMGVDQMNRHAGSWLSRSPYTCVDCNKGFCLVLPVLGLAGRHKRKTENCRYVFTAT